MIIKDIFPPIKIGTMKRKIGPTLERNSIKLNSSPAMSKTLIKNIELSKIELNQIFMVKTREIIGKNHWIAGDYIPAVIECSCEDIHFYHDCGDRKVNMKYVLQSARTDSYYSTLYNIIKTRGFKSPLAAIVDNYYESIILVDGHHRLAIALDLKIKEIPVYISTPGNHIEDLVATDSGNWKEGKISYPPLLDKTKMIR